MDSNEVRRSRRTGTGSTARLPPRRRLKFWEVGVLCSAAASACLLLGIACAAMIEHRARTARDLEAALDASDAVRARSLLLSGASAKTWNTDHTECLIGLAVSSSDLDFVREAIRAGADVNVHGAKGVTPLEDAASMGNVPVMDLLIRAGAEVDGLDYSGCTPLMSACFYGHSGAIEYLLNHGADPGLHDGDGETAFSLAKRSEGTVIPRPILNRLGLGRTRHGARVGARE